MNILLTGGAGFIGSNLCKKLLSNSDYTIGCIDNFNDNYDPSIKEKTLLILIQVKGSLYIRVIY